MGKVIFIDFEDRKVLAVETETLSIPPVPGATTKTPPPEDIDDGDDGCYMF